MVLVFTDGLLILLAVGTQTEDLVRVSYKFELEFLCDILLTGLNGFIYKLHDLSAIDTYKVIMVRSSERFFVSRAVILEPGFEY